MIAVADLAGRLGLDKGRRSWRGDCPACAYARVFSLSEKNGWALAYCANGCPQDTLAETLARAAGTDWKPTAPTVRDLDEAARRERATTDALKIWAGSNAALHTLADAYLTRRALPGLAASATLRFRGDCHHPEQRGRFPAMVALVVDVTGKPVAVHRTYLAHDGRKAALEPAKASKGPVWGGAIRLDPEAPEIVIGEGIESSASVGRLLGLPAWAALSAGNLARGVILPPSVRAVVVGADADKAGQEAAEAAAARWRGEGRRVRIARPDAAGRDFNDILIACGEVPHVA